MNKPNLIVFTGLPGTGKTTLSKDIARELMLPLVAKDAIKERLFDELGWSKGDRDWSTKLGVATFSIMDYVIEEQLRAGHSLVVESNFSPKFANKKFREWQKQYGHNVIQVVCHTSLEVLASRLHGRVTSGERHPGHFEQGTVATYLAGSEQRVANGEDRPLDVPGTVLEVDTTDFTRIDTQTILTKIRASL
jgi:predicted kinase